MNSGRDRSRIRPRADVRRQAVVLDSARALWPSAIPVNLLCPSWAIWPSASSSRRHRPAHDAQHRPAHHLYPGRGCSRRSGFADVPTTRSWYFLSSVDVTAPADTGLIVAFGDSITDGATSTVGRRSLAGPACWLQRLLANPATANLAIVNQGISGNRVLREGTATNALARFDRDVISQPGVKWVMMLEGINDIGQGTGPAPLRKMPSPPTI